MICDIFCNRLTCFSAGGEGPGLGLIEGPHHDRDRHGQHPVVVHGYYFNRQFFLNALN